MNLIINIVICYNGRYIDNYNKDENWTCTDFTAVNLMWTEFVYFLSFVYPFPYLFCRINSDNIF